MSNRKKPESLMAGAPKMGRLRYTGINNIVCDFVSAGSIGVIMLSDDRKNRELAGPLGIVSYSVAEYVKNMPDYPSLADKLKLKDAADSGYGKKFLFPEHLSPNQVFVLFLLSFA